MDILCEELFIRPSERDIGAGDVVKIFQINQRNRSWRIDQAQSIIIVTLSFVGNSKHGTRAVWPSVIRSIAYFNLGQVFRSVDSTIFRPDCSLVNKDMSRIWIILRHKKEEAAVRTHCSIRGGSLLCSDHNWKLRRIFGAIRLVDQGYIPLFRDAIQDLLFLVVSHRFETPHTVRIPVGDTVSDVPFISICIVVPRKQRDNIFGSGRCQLGS